MSASQSHVKKCCLNPLFGMALRMRSGPQINNFSRNRIWNRKRATSCFVSHSESIQRQSSTFSISSSYPSSNYHLQSRFFHSSNLQGKPSTSSPSASASKSTSTSTSSSSSQQLKDQQIKSKYVRLVTPSGLSNQVSKTKDILREMDRSKYWLVQVKAGVTNDKEAKESEGQEEEEEDQDSDSDSSIKRSRSFKRSDNPDQGSNNQFPILENLPLVKFVSKKEAYDRAKAIKLQKKAASSSSSTGLDLSKASSQPPKLIQLTWSVSPNDLSHKLKNGKKDLINKGIKVRLEIITKKGGGKSVAGGEMEKKKLDFLKNVEEFFEKEEIIGEQDGPKEIRKGRMLGQVDWRNNGAVARCTFELVRSKG